MVRPNPKILNKIKEEIQILKKEKKRAEYKAKVKEFIVYLESKELTPMEKAQVYMLNKVYKMTEKEKKAVKKKLQNKMELLGKK